MLAITSDRGAASLAQRPVVLDYTLERFPGQVKPVKFGIAMFQRCDDAQALRVVVEPAMRFEARIQRPLAGVAERRMAEVVGQGQRFREILVKTEGGGAMLRISVEGGGCSGFQYKFDIERAQAQDDLVIERDNAVVLVDPASVPFLAGSEVDFVDDLIGASFRVVNPNATASCGCGTSFSI